MRLSRSTNPSEEHPIHTSIRQLDHAAMDLLAHQPSEAHKRFAEYLEETKNTICGRHPIGVLLGALATLASTDAFKGRFAYHAGKRPWGLLPKVHIALPCATQNEISGEEAQILLKAGVKIVAEGSNMVSTYYASE